MSEPEIQPPYGYRWAKIGETVSKDKGFAFFTIENNIFRWPQTNNFNGNLVEEADEWVCPIEPLPEPLQPDWQALRAQFAGQAMQGHLANIDYEYNCKKIAEYSVQMADALIAELKKQPLNQ